MSWSNGQRILCIRLDAMGDLLMTTPAFRALKRSGIARHLTILTSPSGADAARLVPEVDDLILYDAPWMKATPPRRDPGESREIIAHLAAHAFDAAVVFTVYSQSALPAALLAYWAGIPRRLAHCRENPYHLLTDWVNDPEPEQVLRHEARRQLDLVASVGAGIDDERMSVKVPALARRRIQELLARLGIAPDRFLVVHPGATATSRRYPPERFAAAATELAQRHGLVVVWTGSPGERELIRHCIALTAAPTHDFAGVLTLAEMAALLECAPLLIANNTGPVHLAAALGTKVVDLYALTNPQHTPWLTPHRVLNHDVPCRWCYRSVCPEGHNHCLTLVEPARVVAAAEELLSSQQGAAPCSR